MLSALKHLPDAEIEAEATGVKIFKDPIIYNLIDNYIEWAKNKREAKSEEEFDSLVKPGKLMVLPNCIFRRAKPAVFGVEILGGRIKPKVSLLRAEDSADLGEVDQIQDKAKQSAKPKWVCKWRFRWINPLLGATFLRGMSCT